jgi:H+/Na+-translocating ferredoxin:NAD+ oxidoreductase subunit G
MKDFLKITLSLTVICLAAALILGTLYAKTEHVKKVNQEKMTKRVIRGLLGYGPGKKAPEDFKIHSVYRYVIHEGKTVSLGYIIPLTNKKCGMIQVDLAGNPVKVIPLNEEEAKLTDRAARDAAVKAVMPKGVTAIYAETFYIADKGGKRFGYVVPGVTQGFKTFIDLMVSLSPDFTVTGIAITKSEEDPGLGDEINRKFFKNQFIDKTAETLKILKVQKKPLPGAYRAALTAKVQGPEQKKVEEKHAKDDIYALTGATISSRGVTRGVKDIVRKFTYRLDILAKALKQKSVQVAF